MTTIKQSAPTTPAVRSGPAVRHRRFADAAPSAIATRPAALTMAAVVVAVMLALTRAALVWQVVVDRPLWIDETWSGMIARQPDLHQFALRCASDINAPLSYILIGLWAQIGGLSNLSLRFPALVCALVFPLIALMPNRLVGLRARQIWCILLACWPYAMMFSTEARYYSLYVLLGCCNTLAYASLMERANPRRAWVWSITAALFVLSHYFALILVGIQGLVYLATWRVKAWRTWPAALAFLPAFAVLAAHFQVLAAFAKPGVSWIPGMTPAGVALMLQQAVLPLGIFLWTIVWACAALMKQHYAPGGAVLRATPMPGHTASSAVRMSVACAVAALALALGIGFIKPIVMGRYLVGFVPAVFLGLALLAERFERSWAIAPVVLVIPVMTVGAITAVYAPKRIDPLQYQTASEYLMRQSPDRLVFMWDNPMEMNPGKSFDETAIRDVASFFFDRAGKRITTVNVHPEAGIDPAILLRRAGIGPRTAVLWLYDLGVAGTSAQQFPPHIADISPGLRCKNFGIGDIGIIACSRAQGS